MTAVLPQSGPVAIAAGFGREEKAFSFQKAASRQGTISPDEIKWVRHATDSVRFIVIHCSATRADREYTAEQLERDHLKRGFRTTGYHFYIRQDGSTTHPRLLGEVGAHAKGVNRCSIGVCYEGGLDAGGHPADTRTRRQKERLLELLTLLRRIYPQAMIIGHNQLSPNIRKACPCFDARGEYEGL